MKKMGSYRKQKKKVKEKTKEIARRKELKNSSKKLRRGIGKLEMKIRKAIWR